MSMMRKLMFGCLLSALPALAVWQVGDTPSNFNCTDWNGQPWSLSAQVGKVVLINFGATW